MTFKISIAGALVLALAFVALVMVAGLDTTPTAEAQEPTATESGDGTPGPTSTTEATSEATSEATNTPGSADLPSTGQGPGDSSGSSAGWIVAALAGIGAAAMGLSAWRLRRNRA